MDARLFNRLAISVPIQECIHLVRIQPFHHLKLARLNQAHLHPTRQLLPKRRHQLRIQMRQPRRKRLLIPSPLCLRNLLVRPSRQQCRQLALPRPRQTRQRHARRGCLYVAANRLADHIQRVHELVADNLPHARLHLGVRSVPVHDVRCAQRLQSLSVPCGRDGDDGAETGHARKCDAVTARVCATADDEDCLVAVVGLLPLGRRRETELVWMKEGDKWGDGVDGERGHAVGAVGRWDLGRVGGVDDGIFLKACLVGRVAVEEVGLAENAIAYGMVGHIGAKLDDGARDVGGKNCGWEIVVDEKAVFYTLRLG